MTAAATTIDVDPKHPITIGTTPIASLAIKKQSFADYIEASQRAQKSAGDNLTAAFRREWILTFVEPRDRDGKSVPFGVKDILDFPATYPLRFLRAQGRDSSPAGEIVRDGDGLSEPLIYRLGTPLSIAGSNGESQVTELEFLIRSYGDIEPVMDEAYDLARTLALVRTCATPLGMDATLLRLPDFAMKQITISDGITISEKVAPRFFELPN